MITPPTLTTLLPPAAPALGLDLLLQITVLLGAVLLVERALRRASAATRAAVLQAGVVGAVLVPLFLVRSPLPDAVAWRPALPAAWSAPAGSVETGAAAFPAAGFSAFALLGSVLIVVWATGTVIALLVLARRICAVRRLVAPVAERDAADRRRVVAASGVALPRPVRVVLRDDTATPFVFGTVTPVIVLSPAALDWTPATLAAALRHELAHVERRDPAWRLLGAVVAAVFWFHPFARTLVRRLHQASERACDDRVLAADVRPSDYAMLVLRTRPGRRACPPPWPRWPAPARSRAA